MQNQNSIHENKTYNKNKRPSMTKKMMMSLFRTLRSALINHSFKKIISKREIKLGPFKGGQKSVYKIHSEKTNKDLAVSVISLPFLSDKYNEQFVRRIKSSKLWHKKYLSRFINKEYFLISKNNNSILIVQPWVDSKPGYENIFYDIVGNVDNIIKKAKEDKKFAKELKDFVETLIVVYEKTSRLPDIFNNLVKSPANVLFSKDNKIVIIDTHLFFCHGSGCNDKKVREEDSSVNTRSNFTLYVYAESFIRTLYMIYNELKIILRKK